MLEREKERWQWVGPISLETAPAHQEPRNTLLTTIQTSAAAVS